MENKLSPIDSILLRIKETRKNKGYTYDTMALELDITPTAYRKIETKETRLTVEKLLQIVDILNTDIEKVMDIKTNDQLNQVNNDNAVGYLQKIENFYQESKENIDKIEKMFEARLQDKDIIIENQKQMIEVLRKK